MAEYIEREANCCNCYHKEACDAWVRHGKILYDDYSYSTERCKYYVPTADVVEVRHGKWVEHRQPDAWGYSVSYTCSVCGKEKDDNTDSYCSDCGADMDGK